MQDIDAIHRACAVRSDVIGLAGGLPDPALFPRDAMREALATVMSDPNLVALQYGWPEGDASLREWIASRSSVSADDVIVTAGAQQAIALAIDSLGSLSSIGVGSATYPVALELFRTRGLAATDAPVAETFYLMPDVSNPSGVPIDDAYAASVRTCGAPVIADDAYAELRFDGARTNLSSSFSGAWRIGTFAKTLCPGLRIGFVVPPRQHRARVLRLKHGADLQANSLGQAVLVELFRRFDYDEHLRRARSIYARRADALATAIHKHLPAWTFAMPEGGFSIFADTRTPGDDVAFLAAASARGVSFDPGHIFRPIEHPTIELRVCFSNVRASLADEAVRRLALAWSDFNARRSASRRRASRTARAFRP